ncbi:4604_t:CDS:2 [Cetraspora pellucida]|uniref:4604_t:CDS:1 n=1 Tax=Cetraspora pellucida TaxID=1433469 RepID=A0ACA9L5N2_9GLOM|nr:4604_t:CDS:2 [Cetraspora pellucida]
MASAPPTLCFNEIFKYLHGDISSLHSCALVNHHWSEHAIPELWRDPFVVTKSKSRRAKLIYSLLPFLDRNAKHQFVPSALYRSPCYHYLSYMRNFSFSGLVKISKGFAREVVPENYKKSVFKKPIDTKFVKVLCHAIVSYCHNLERIDNDLTAPFFQNRFHINQQQLTVSQWNFFKFPGANTSFSRLRCLYVDNLNASSIINSAATVVPELTEITIRMYTKNFKNRLTNMTYSDELLPKSSLYNLKSFPKLERFNIVEGQRTKWRSFNASSFLIFIGHKLPQTVKHFCFDINCEFSANSLKEFLDNTASHLTSLSFARSKKFSRDHLDVICKHKDVHIEMLDISSSKITDESILDMAKAHISTVRFDSTMKGHSPDTDDKFQGLDDPYFRRNWSDYYNDARDSSDFENDTDLDNSDFELNNNRYVFLEVDPSVLLKIMYFLLQEI